MKKRGGGAKCLPLALFISKPEASTKQDSLKPENLCSFSVLPKGLALISEYSWSEEHVSVT